MITGAVFSITRMTLIKKNTENEKEYSTGKYGWLQKSLFLFTEEHSTSFQS